MEMWGLPTKWDPCEDGSCYLFSLSWSKGILSIWVSTVIAELATRGFPRDTWVPGASPCSSKWLLCGFLLLAFSKLNVCLCKPLCGAPQPFPQGWEAKRQVLVSLYQLYCKDWQHQGMPISLTDLIFLSVSTEKEMLMVKEWDGVLSCSRILSDAKRH